MAARKSLVYSTAGRVEELPAGDTLSSATAASSDSSTQVATTEFVKKATPPQRVNPLLLLDFWYSGVPVTTVGPNSSFSSPPREWYAPDGYAVVEDADPNISSTYAFTFPAMSTNQSKSFSFITDATSADNTLLVRYKVDSEADKDVFRVLVDGVPVKSDSGSGAGWQVWSYTLAIGRHEVRLEYSTDASNSVGFNNVRFSRLTYPRRQYAYGDIVYYNGSRYFALKNYPTTTPGSDTSTASEWLGIGDVAQGASNFLFGSSNTFAAPGYDADALVKMQAQGPASRTVIRFSYNSDAFVATIVLDSAGFKVGSASVPLFLSGSTVTAPTPTAGDNSTAIATTAYVQGAGFAKTATANTFTATQTVANPTTNSDSVMRVDSIGATGRSFIRLSSLGGGYVSTFYLQGDGNASLSAPSGKTLTISGTVTFPGAATATTQAQTDNSTLLATTAFVKAAISAGTLPAFTATGTGIGANQTITVPSGWTTETVSVTSNGVVQPNDGTAYSISGTTLSGTFGLGAKVIVRGYGGATGATGGQISGIVTISTSASSVSTDRNRVVDAVSSSAIVYTVVDDSGWPVGSTLVVRRGGAGAVTIAAGSGVTLQAAGGRLSIAEQYAAVEIVKMAANVFWVVGNLIA